MFTVKQTTFVLLFVFISSVFSGTPFTVVEENLNTVSVSFIQSAYYLEDTNDVTLIKYDSLEDYNHENTGHPLLPVFNTTIQIPNCSSVEGSLIVGSDVAHSGIILSTVQPIQSVAGELNGEYVPIEGYAGNFSCDYELHLGKPLVWHGYTFVPLTLVPFAYDASTGKLTAITEATITLTMEDATEGTYSGKPLSTQMAEIFSQSVLNPPNLIIESVGNRPEYLLLTNVDSRHWGIEYAKYRILTGYDVYYKEVDHQEFIEGDHDNPQSLEVHDIIDSYDPKYVFIVGDYSSDNPDVAPAWHHISASNRGGDFEGKNDVWTDQLYGTSNHRWFDHVIGRLPYYDHIIFGTQEFSLQGFGGKDVSPTP